MSQSADQNHRLLKILFLVSFVTLLLAATGYRIGKDLAIRIRRALGSTSRAPSPGCRRGAFPLAPVLSPASG